MPDPIVQMHSDRIAEAPAKFATRFLVFAGNDVSRVAFGESWNGSPDRYHTAIVMTTEDWLTLAKLIPELVAAQRNAQ